MKIRFLSRPLVVAIVLAVQLIPVLPAGASEPPINDTINSATAVDAIPFSDRLDTTLATRSDSDPPTSGRECFGSEARTVWYRFVAPARATYALDTAGSDYGTTVAVYQGDSLIDCSAYFNGSFQGRVLIAAEKGARYDVMVAATSPDDAGVMLSFRVEDSPVAPLNVDLTLSPRAALLGNGEVELRGEVTCSRTAEVGLDGVLKQGDTQTFFYPEVFTCGPAPTPFRAPTRGWDPAPFQLGTADALVIAYGYDRFDRHVPEVNLEIEVGPAPMVFVRSVGGFDEPTHAEIFVMDGDGNRVRQLTNNETEDSFPATSPDGQWIAFARSVGGQFDLFVMDVDGRNLERLTSTPHDEVLPTWAPNGRKLAYTATFDTTSGWQSDIYKIRLRDGRTRKLTDSKLVKEFAPEWAPDGALIAFTKQNQRRHRYGIATVRPNGKGSAWLVLNPLGDDGYTDVNPTWSPDSQWVAFSRDHGADPYVDIYKVSRDGTEVEPVTQLFALAENPTWGPDGRIAFQLDEGIAVTSGDGDDIRFLTPTLTTVPYRWPDW